MLASSFVRLFIVLAASVLRGGVGRGRAVDVVETGGEQTTVTANSFRSIHSLPRSYVNMGAAGSKPDQETTAPGDTTFYAARDSPVQVRPCPHPSPLSSPPLS